MSAIRNACYQLQDVSIGIDQLTATITETEGINGLAELAGLIHDTQQVLGHMAAVVAAEILAVDLVGGPDQPYPIPSGGQLVRRGGSKRKNYDQARVISVIKARLADHIGSTGVVGVLTDEGERVPTSLLVDPVVDLMTSLTGASAPSFDSWRVKAAKDLGIKLDDFHEWVTGELRIVVEGRNQHPTPVPAPVYVRTQHEVAS